MITSFIIHYKEDLSRDGCPDLSTRRAPNSLWANIKKSGSLISSLFFGENRPTRRETHGKGTLMMNSIPLLHAWKTSNTTVERSCSEHIIDCHSKGAGMAFISFYSIKRHAVLLHLGIIEKPDKKHLIMIGYVFDSIRILLTFRRFRLNSFEVNSPDS